MWAGIITRFMWILLTLFILLHKICVNSGNVFLKILYDDQPPEKTKKDGDKEEENVTSNMGLWIVWICLTLLYWLAACCLKVT